MCPGVWEQEQDHQVVLNPTTLMPLWTLVVVTGVVQESHYTAAPLQELPMEK